MNAAEADLHCYHLARQLQLVPELHQVFQHNAMVYPVFYYCLDAKAKAEVRHVLLCLQRWILAHCAKALQALTAGAGANPEGLAERVAAMEFLQVQTYHRGTRLILSFLSFPEPHYHSPPPRSLRLQQKPDLKEEGDAEAEPATAEDPHTPPRTPQPASAVTSPAKAVRHPAEDGAAPLPDTPARRPAGSERAAPEVPLREQPLFYLRPQPITSNDMHHLFVRMVYPERLNDEKLNTYFGRYGQTASALQQRLTLTEAGLGLPLTQALALQHKSTPEQLLVQDFLITVDTYGNALRAVQQAYYRELLFIALHDPASNTFTLGDLDELVEQQGTVYRSELRPLAAPPAPKRGRDAPKRARDGSSDSSSSYSSSSEEDEEDGFVPDVLVDGLPYWMLEEDIRTLLQPYGTLVALRVSESDHSGAFTGAVLARLATVDEALHVTQGVHGMVYHGHTLLCGVLNERMEVVSLKGEAVLQAAPEECRGARGEYFAVGQNERLWV
ncbi:RNA-binding protein [Strigomonas culicis]|uniref:RNA-binding protein n=1 Tax=Strigomonas culicis TaxID=28005 RepID=S9UCY8_9TRYP|nr:RNA-binding protein [Strigomonas culicis]EPY28667.1 RNA-binding protein [Strigomonas culicis]|eukprot:EPY28261.1 RNA-binding protein [Strigomonas culicis]